MDMIDELYFLYKNFFHIIAGEVLVSIPTARSILQGTVITMIFCYGKSYVCMERPIRNY